MFLKLTVFITTFFVGNGYELKQVIVLSRHNIRAPFHYDISTDLLSPKPWPTWNMEPGALTPKGRLLEHHMGKYFSDWMIKEKLLDNNCPGDEVFVYANTRSRTKETAKAFAEGAFGDCVRVLFKNITDHDPIFRFKVRNDSAEFKTAVLNEAMKNLNSTDLRNAFLELNRIADFGHSSYCKTEKVCDLSEAKTEIVFDTNMDIPRVSGGVNIGWSFVDSCLMAYYDGMAPENVAWGQIQTKRQWETIMAMLRTYLELRFETKILDRDIALPLLKYLSDIFQNGRRKFYLLVAQDANISVLTTSLGFKRYILDYQLERTPIGGKVVFQKWYNEEKDQDLLRVNYVYQSTEQIRDGVEVSLQDPPQWQLLEMKKCAVDENGFCPWNDFINILNTV
ncbi:glucose-1-phosphatase-like [Cydia splendana]|uniref:glucose-1-phosphatase-like n=1 Tax=Cydia splendana TaxID=1100963 RepID=UPI00300D9388